MVVLSLSMAIGKNTCEWPTDNPLLMEYHDTEWGVPVHDDRKHFEFLVLETSQAGLSWLTILKKRENYRRAFDNFVPALVAEYDEKKVQALKEDAGIIRNERKIRAAISNAKRFLEVQSEFGSFDAYMWSWMQGKQLVNTWKSIDEMPVTTPLSDTLSKDMKKRGFTFVGSTTLYAHIQAIGLVNDHIVTCWRHAEITNMK